jgi:hypothetical protein
MYRVLEHLVGRLKTRRLQPDSITEMFMTPGPSSTQVMELLNARYANLPAVYRSTRIMTGDIKVDRFGFQAANIAITFQTVKLVLAGAENHSVARSCEIAGELLDALANIPTSYIMAISAPMVSPIILAESLRQASSPGQLWSPTCKRYSEPPISMGPAAGSQRPHGNDRPPIRSRKVVITLFGRFYQITRTRSADRVIYDSGSPCGTARSSLSQCSSFTHAVLLDT